jgi:hypothetical protein
VKARADDKGAIRNLPYPASGKKILHAFHKFVARKVRNETSWAENLHRPFPKRLSSNLSAGTA